MRKRGADRRRGKPYRPRRHVAPTGSTCGRCIVCSPLPLFGEIFRMRSPCSSGGAIGGFMSSLPSLVCLSVPPPLPHFFPSAFPAALVFFFFTCGEADRSSNGKCCSSCCWGGGPLFFSPCNIFLGVFYPAPLLFALLEPSIYSSSSSPSPLSHLYLNTPLLHVTWSQERLPT